MADSPDMQRLLAGLDKLKADAAANVSRETPIREKVEALTGLYLKTYQEGVTDGLALAIEALQASAKEAEGSGWAPGLDLAIQTLSLSLEMAKAETGQ